MALEYGRVDGGGRPLEYNGIERPELLTIIMAGDMLESV